MIHLSLIKGVSDEYSFCFCATKRKEARTIQNEPRVLISRNDSPMKETNIKNSTHIQKRLGIQSQKFREGILHFTLDQHNYIQLISTF